MKEIILLLLISVFVFSVISFAGITDLKTQTACPIPVGKTYKNLSQDHKGKQNCVCCSDYKIGFLKELEKYLK